MALRLGEVLIQNGIINESQLKAALDAQLIYGGHLGTCLVELGFVEVDVLAKVLSDQFSVDPAERERILKIDPMVTGTLSASLVVKHKAIPFDLKERVLHVAMVDPKNLLALDELSFASGYRIEAWIAPEILVHRAMEHYYKVPRTLRHISLSDSKLKTPATTETTPGADETPPPEQVPEPSVPPPEIHVPEEPAVVAEPETSSVRPWPTAAPEPQLAKEPSAHAEEEFVAQTRPQIHARPERRDDALPAKPRDGKLAIDWIKRKHGDEEHWCDLYRVPVSHEHFNDVAGVYVIWHNGRNPVLRMGQGYVRTEISTLKLDPRIRSIAADGPVFVSWAAVQRTRRDGVERYLIDMLGPQIVTDVPDMEPIEVNLPG
jgi:hypothetical protein